MTNLSRHLSLHSVAALFLTTIAAMFVASTESNANECTTVVRYTSSVTTSAAGPVVFIQQPIATVAMTQFVQQSTVGPSVLVPEYADADVEIIPVPAPEPVPVPVHSKGVDVIGFVKKGDLRPDGIEVEIIGAGVERTRTDNNGQFRFRAMLPGQYIIRAEGPVQNYVRTAARAIELGSDVVIVELELR